MPRPSLRWLPFVAAVGLAALAGCDREEIHSYTVPRPAVGESKVRLLAAVFDVDDHQWYFKLVGPKADVEAQADAFAKFVSSARFLKDAKKPVIWDVPPTWEKGEAKDLRFVIFSATFYPDPKNKAVELTVSELDQQSPLVDNVNRWCDRDLGRPHLRKRDVDLTDDNEDVVTRIRAGDKRGVLVKLDGPGPRAVKHPPMVAKGMPKEASGLPPQTKRPAVKLPLIYALPQGWVETGPRTMVANSFVVREGGRAAEAQISEPLGANFGDPLENVNRWRAQVGLPRAKAIDPKPATIKVSEIASEYYDFVGPQGKRMLLVVVRHGQQTWFFKLIGDAQVVGDNRGKFESFVQSVKFTGAAE